MKESLAEFYFDKLKTTDNPVVTLANFYKSVFDIETLDSMVYRKFGRLYKLYGSELLFFAILDSSDMEVNPDTFERLLSYFAKKRLENKFNFTPSVSLEDEAKKIQKELDKKVTFKIPDPFREEKE